MWLHVAPAKRLPKPLLLRLNLSSIPLIKGQPRTPSLGPKLQDSWSKNLDWVYGQALASGPFTDCLRGLSPNTHQNLINNPPGKPVS